jgi:hypothetical protein
MGASPCAGGGVSAPTSGGGGGAWRWLDGWAASGCPREHAQPHLSHAQAVAAVCITRRLGGEGVIVAALWGRGGKRFCLCLCLAGTRSGGGSRFCRYGGWWLCCGGVVGRLHSRHRFSYPRHDLSRQAASRGFLFFFFFLFFLFLFCFPCRGGVASPDYQPPRTLICSDMGWMEGGVVVVGVADAPQACAPRCKVVQGKSVASERHWVFFVCLRRHPPSLSLVGSANMG